MSFKFVGQLISTAALAGALSILAAAPQSDNTKNNKDAQPTADQAKNSTADRDLMQKIRQSIMADKSLSTYAHNIKIIAQDGKVTLKGPVHSDEEKTSIVSKATEVAGAVNVTDELTVKSDGTE